MRDNGEAAESDFYLFSKSGNVVTFEMTIQLVKFSRLLFSIAGLKTSSF